MKKLKLNQKKFYIFEKGFDPLRFYYWPGLGSLFRKRLELCLDQCISGSRILEVGYGAGITFMNLDEIFDEIHGIDLHENNNIITEQFSKINIYPKLHKANIIDIPYPDNYFDTVLLISILEHLKPNILDHGLEEVRRVLKPGGQIVYGVPVEHPIMVFIFKILGYDIRQHHFSTEFDVKLAVEKKFLAVNYINLKSPIPTLKYIYQIGHLIKN